MAAGGRLPNGVRPDAASRAWRTAAVRGESPTDRLLPPPERADGGERPPDATAPLFGVAAPSCSRVLRR